jgi:hypothetical protein
MPEPPTSSASHDEPSTGEIFRDFRPDAIEVRNVDLSDEDSWASIAGLAPHWEIAYPPSPPEGSRWD